MNWNTLEGKWEQLKSEVKNKWAKLTDDDVGQIAAKRDNLIGKLQERYGMLKDEAERQVDDWLAQLNPPPSGRAR